MLGLVGWRGSGCCDHHPCFFSKQSIGLLQKQDFIVISLPFVYGKVIGEPSVVLQIISW